MRKMLAAAVAATIGVLTMSLHAYAFPTHKQIFKSVPPFVSIGIQQNSGTPSNSDPATKIDVGVLVGPDVIPHPQFIATPPNPVVGATIELGNAG